MIHKKIIKSENHIYFEKNSLSIINQITYPNYLLTIQQYQNTLKT